ncbi:MAG: manganese ABC transporter permease [Chloroflexi bacterium]|nr:MAG: manganese ABC transporter permease [Chloroflexota bacterium]
MIAGVLSALAIGLLTRGRRITEDTAIGIIFAGMLALGIAIISRAENYAVDLNHILIGNILTVRESDLILMAVVGAFVLIIVAALYKEFLIISFDETLAQTLHLPGEFLRLVLLILIALTIVIGVQAVGIALVAAMLVTPSATARFLTKRLHHLMIVAALIGAFSGVTGMYLAWHLEVEASAAIVLTMTALFVITYLFAPRRGYFATRHSV